MNKLSLGAATATPAAAQGEPDPPADRRMELQLALDHARCNHGDPLPARIKATTLPLRCCAP